MNKPSRSPRSPRSPWTGLRRSPQSQAKLSVTDQIPNTTTEALTIFSSELKLVDAFKKLVAKSFSACSVVENDDGCYCGTLGKFSSQRCISNSAHSVSSFATTDSTNFVASH